jgi:hypothetical protein
MLEALNRFGAAYGGLLGVAGVMLAICGVLYGVYSRNNPTRPKHRLQFAVYAADDLLLDFWAGRRRRSRNQQTFLTVVDVWNSGSEPVPSNIIREPLALVLQDPGVQILTAQVTHQTHPTVSDFGVEAVGRSAALNWKHFDPGMGVRIEVATDRPTQANAIQLSGSGYRLEVQRGLEFDDTSTIFGKTIKGILQAVIPVVTFSVISGAFLAWLQDLKISGQLWYFVGVPTILVLTIVLSVSIGIGFGLKALIGFAVNTRSPLLRQFGPPQIVTEAERMRALAQYHSTRGMQEAQRDIRISSMRKELKTLKKNND